MLPSQLIHDGSGDRASGARVGMSIPSETPRRINVDQDVRYVSVVENPATQSLFRLRLMPELQHDEQRRCPVRSRQFAGGTKHLLGHGYAAFDGRIGAVRYD